MIAQIVSIVPLTGTSHNSKHDLQSRLAEDGVYPQQYACTEQDTFSWAHITFPIHRNEMAQLSMANGVADRLHAENEMEEVRRSGQLLSQSLSSRDTDFLALLTSDGHPSCPSCFVLFSGRPSYSPIENLFLQFLSGIYITN